MQINIENIGLIREGQICIENIAVIAGANDSGKSTVGKILYATIKAGLNYENDYKEYIIELLVKKSKVCYRQLRKVMEPDYYERMLSEISPKLFERRLKSSLESFGQILEFANDYVFQLERIYKYVDIYDLDFRNIDGMKDLIESVSYNPFASELIGSALMRNLTSEFNNDISTRFAKRPSRIELLEGRNPILNFEFFKNDILNIRMHDEIMAEDITYIESPLILNNIKNVSNMTGRNKDLAEKLTRSPYTNKFWYHQSLDKLEIKLNSTQLFEEIDGKLEYSADDAKFYYKKNNRTKFDVDNIASGVKSFAMMELLMNNRVFTEGSILILDEPELHLHPKWQVEYGKVICKLAKQGVKIVVSTHSPYIIQSINFFSGRILEEKVNYYLMDKCEENYTRIEDCTYNLNRIYKLLSQPIEDLVWG